LQSDIALYSKNRIKKVVMKRPYENNIRQVSKYEKTNTTGTQKGQK
jgi:hypothetical protein